MIKIDKKKEKFKKIFLSIDDHLENKERCHFIENIVIIGSSCVNPAAENIMDVIYSKTNKKPIFRTSHHYKSRSEYWQYGKPLNDKIEDTEKSGIYIGEKKIGNRERCRCKEELFLRRDTALLVICSGSFYRKACGIDYNKNMNMLKGDIILMAGFGKYGTYELSRMLSKINKPSSNPYNSVEIKSSKDVFIPVEELFSEINNAKSDKKMKAYTA